MRLAVPVLFIIFNKVEATREVFYVIRRQKPNKLYIAADGPRIGRERENEKCMAIRKWVLDNIDWECEVKTLFREENIGCGRGPSEAISWFFANVNEGIILEDDCLPNDSFFRFCEENLAKYRDNTNISIISGNNFQEIQPMAIKEDYYFSVFPSTHGWATWKRTWDGYDYTISSWKKLKKRSLLKFLFNEKKYQEWWRIMFDITYNNPPEDAWDWQFHYHCMVRKQLAVIPKANLISNIGYGPDATHSKDPNCYFANVPRIELTFPLIHPGEVKRNYDADIFIQKHLFGEAEIVSQAKQVKRWIKSRIKRIKA